MSFPSSLHPAPAHKSLCCLRYLVVNLDPSSRSSGPAAQLEPLLLLQEALKQNIKNHQFMSQPSFKTATVDFY